MATYNNSKLVDELIAKAEKQIAAEFGAIVLAMQGEHGLRALAELLKEGRFDEALASLDAAAGKLADAVSRVYVGAGVETAKQMGDKFGVIVSFDQTNVRAARIMANNRLSLIRDFVQGQRDAVQVALRHGIETGMNPIAQARLFRESIGLTAKQMEWVGNYRRELENLDSNALSRKLRDGRFDRTLLKAIDHDSPLSKAQIDKMVGRYRDRWVAFRAETIARTESLSTVHEGTNEAIQQAVESGAAEDAESEWNSSDDDRVRDFDDGPTSHVSMHHQKRPFGEPFESGAGSLIRWPGDPEAPPYDRIKCRCRVSTRVSG